MESVGNELFPELKYELNDRKAFDQMSEIISRTTHNLESVFDHHWIQILVENSVFFDTIVDFKIKQKKAAGSSRGDVIVIFFQRTQGSARAIISPP